VVRVMIFRGFNETCMPYKTRVLFVCAKCMIALYLKGL
jgi:hypothetical protein